MSALLDALIQERKAQAHAYRAYLEKLEQLAHQVKQPEQTAGYPTTLDTPGKRALYDNLDCDAALALRIDAAVLYARLDDWRSNTIKERVVFYAIRQVLGGDVAQAQAICELVKHQSEY